MRSMLNELSLAIEDVRYLKQRKMHTAKRELTHSNFLRSISHDIRTPLTTIMGNLDILVSHSKDMSIIEKRTITCA